MFSIDRSLVASGRNPTKRQHGSQVGGVQLPIHEARSLLEAPTLNRRAEMVSNL